MFFYNKNSKLPFNLIYGHEIWQKGGQIYKEYIPKFILGSHNFKAWFLFLFIKNTFLFNKMRTNNRTELIWCALESIFKELSNAHPMSSVGPFVKFDQMFIQPQST